MPHTSGYSTKAGMPVEVISLQPDPAGQGHIIGVHAGNVGSSGKTAPVIGGKHHPLSLFPDQAEPGIFFHPGASDILSPIAGIIVHQDAFQVTEILPGNALGGPVEASFCIKEREDH
jgi:hypothetical protein